jgi:hypothetical protein
VDGGWGTGGRVNVEWDPEEIFAELGVRLESKSLDLPKILQVP